MSEKKEITKKEGEEIATAIGPFVQYLDIMLQLLDINRMLDYLNAMRHDAGMLGALPWPETLNKADKIEAQCKFFESIINAMEARKKVQEMATKKSFTTGSDVLKMMGMEGT